MDFLESPVFWLVLIVEFSVFLQARISTQLVQGSELVSVMVFSAIPVCMAYLTSYLFFGSIVALSQIAFCGIALFLLVPPLDRFAKRIEKQISGQETVFHSSS